jgi:predicted DNA-binding transcriptional regulator AlpA
MTATGDMTRGSWMCRECGHRNMMEEGPVCENCETDNSASDTGDMTRLDMHPDDLLGNESVRALCAHHLGQDVPVGRPTLLRWRRERGFPAPLPCGRAGVELWDARQVREWVQQHARNLPKTRPVNLRKAPGN